MAMELSRRSIIGAALATAIPAATGFAAGEDSPASSVKGKLTDKSLETLLKAMGFELKVEEKRYDFAFKATIDKEEWELSMSAVLSQDTTSVWVMAWLDELPKSAADVPRTALLRLLSDNDKLGKGKFFAYIAANRRFVLQRVVANEDMTSEKFRAILDDLGQSVVATHPHWLVSNWNASTAEDPAQAAKTGAPVKGSTQTSASSTAAAPKTSTAKTADKPAVKIEKTAINDSKFSGSSKK